MFELQPVQEYTENDLNWSNDDSRVAKEYEDESLINIELKDTSPDNWQDYDTVFIGYPIW